MTSFIGHLSVDARDPYEQSLWWSLVLGFAEDPADRNHPADEECMIVSPDGRTRLLFIAVPEAKTVKNRLHLDLRPSDVSRDEEIDRVLSLGATAVADHRTPEGRGWLVLADPEGNEFCILRSEAEVAQQGPALS